MMGVQMSEQIERDLASTRTDVALLKQELYYIKDAFRNMQNMFRWALVMVFGGVMTAVVNFVVGGGLKP
jgi:hypothetical protein